MENKINIAELLKDCPKGMELDCTLYDNCTFEDIEDVGYINIVVNTPSGIIKLTKEGCYFRHDDNAKCVIFPKGKTTWEGFIPPCPFKCGDILYTRSDDADSEPYEYIFIFKGITENVHVNSYLHIKGDDLRISEVWLTNCGDKYLRFATEEEKQKLFDVLKAKGYKWNAETKTLEKLIAPKFKVGDKIRKKGEYSTYTITDVKYEHYCCGKYVICNIHEDDWELVPDKFDINTLKPFYQVLVRCSTLEKWRIQLFEKYDKDCKYPFICMGYNKYKQCIPYEGNEHLFDTADDCNDFYKTWE